MLFLSKIIILHIFYRFIDHTTKDTNSSHETSQTSTQFRFRAIKCRIFLYTFHVILSKKFIVN